MLPKKVRKFIFLVICFLWVTSDLFTFSLKPVEAQTTMSACGASPGAAALCAQLMDGLATRTALTSSNAAATASQVTTKVVQRGSEILLREVTVPNPFNATLGKWAASVGLGGLITFMGIPSLDNARESLVAQYAARNPGTGGKEGQVPGKMYKIVGTSSEIQGGTATFGPFIGPISISHSLATWRNPPKDRIIINGDTYGEWFDFDLGNGNSASTTVMNLSTSIIRLDGTSKADDIANDPNGNTAPASWASATTAQRQNIIDTASDNDLQNLYSLAPVAGVPSPSGTEDVYYKPAGSQEWVKLENTTPASIIPKDATVNSEGNIVYPDGRILRKDGSILSQNGAVRNPDGSVLNPNGTTTPSDGSVLNPDGTITLTDGSVLNPDGSVTNPDGSVTNPDGSVYQPGNGTLDVKTFTGTFFVSYAVEKLSQKFPFDIVGLPASGAASNECPNYTFFDEVIELCILKDAFIIILIPFKIGLATIFYQKI